MKEGEPVAAGQGETPDVSAPDDAPDVRAPEMFRVFSIYAVIAAGITYPWILHFGTALPLGSVDLWQNYWNFWWWKYSLFELGTTPYWTDLLFYPDGTSLAFHTHSPLNMIATLPVSYVFGPVAAYNVAQFVGFPLSALGAYLLAQHLFGDRKAAWIAGLVYAFFPHRVEQAMEHLNLASIQFIPFFVLYLVKTLETGSRRSALACGLFFAANALVCWHYGIFALALGLIVLAFHAREVVADWRGRLPSLALSAGVATLAVAPFVVPMLTGIAGGDAYIKPPEPRGIDLYFLLLPLDHQLLFGRFTEAAYREWRAYTNAGFACFMGWLPALLSLTAIVRRRRERVMWMWLCVSGVFLVLACGAHPLWKGALHEEITLPHALFELLPGLRALRVANRFVVPFMLGVSMLSAAAIADLPRTPSRSRWVGLAAAIIVFEFLWFPFPLQRVERSEILHSMQGEDGGAVLSIPFSNRGQTIHTQVAQTQHHRPIYGGYISVPPIAGTNRILHDPLLSRLVSLDPLVPERISALDLQSRGIRYVLFHKDRVRETLARRRAVAPDRGFYYRKSLDPRRGIPREKFETLSALFREALGEPVWEDASYRVFRVD